MDKIKKIYINILTKLVRYLIRKYNLPIQTSKFIINHKPEGVIRLRSATDIRPEAAEIYRNLYNKDEMIEVIDSQVRDKLVEYIIKSGVIRTFIINDPGGIPIQIIKEIEVVKNDS